MANIHGKVTITTGTDGKPVATLVETTGLMSQAMDAVTTAISTQEVPVGNGALIQRLLLLVGGNMLATQSLSGSIGVSVAGKTFALGK